MRLEYESLETLKQEFYRIIGKHININEYRIFFFGSRVIGKGNERSDIDIGIEGTEPLPITVLSKIGDEIDSLPILYSVDVVDFSRATQKFKKIALQHIEPIP